MEVKTLIILRGIPGSGKSTVAELLAENNKYPVCTADDFFMREVDGELVYQWDGSKAYIAHKMCQQKAEFAMKNETEKIIIANTNTTEREMKPYMEMADVYGYRVVRLIVENHHGGTNVHGVTDEIIETMKNRLMCNVKL